MFLCYDVIKLLQILRERNGTCKIGGNKRN